MGFNSVFKGLMHHRVMYDCIIKLIQSTWFSFSMLFEIACSQVSKYPNTGYYKILQPTTYTLYRKKKSVSQKLQHILANWPCSGIPLNNVRGSQDLFHVKTN
jgi:hypothetical protein